MGKKNQYSFTGFPPVRMSGMLFKSLHKFIDSVIQSKALMKPYWRQYIMRKDAEKCGRHTSLLDQDRNHT